MTDTFGPDDPDEPYDNWDARWEDTGEPEWWQESVTIYNDFFQPLTMVAEDWFNQTFSSSEENMALFGIDTLDIIRQLEAQGLWGVELDEYGHSIDWAYWRENYGEM